MKLQGKKSSRCQSKSGGYEGLFTTHQDEDRFDGFCRARRTIGSAMPCLEGRGADTHAMRLEPRWRHLPDESPAALEPGASFERRMRQNCQSRQCRPADKASSDRGRLGTEGQTRLTSSSSVSDKTAASSEINRVRLINNEVMLVYRPMFSSSVATRSCKVTYETG